MTPVNPTNLQLVLLVISGHRLIEDQEVNVNYQLLNTLCAFVANSTMLGKLIDKSRHREDLNQNLLEEFLPLVVDHLKFLGYDSPEGISEHVTAVLESFGDIIDDVMIPKKSEEPEEPEELP